MATRTVDLGPVVGPQGPAGPNEITSATETDLTGFLYGDGSNVGVRAISNRNLLDNPWFTGGGSQQGGGQFPINQRGSTSYSVVPVHDDGLSDGYTIDRWKLSLWNTTSPSVQLLSNGLRVAGNASGSCTCKIEQKIENPAWLSGKTVTISCLVVDKTAGGGGLRLSLSTNVSGGDGNSVQITGTGLFTKTVTLPSGVTSAEVWIGQDGNYAGTGNTDFTIAAVKMELGSVSTLANDAPPHFASELAKCQRFYWDSEATSDSGIVYFGVAGTDALGFPVATPVPMRQVTPTVQMTVT
jgi:hypothetical protein